MVQIAVSTSMIEQLQRLLDERGVPGVELVAVDTRAQGPDLTGIQAAVRWDLDGNGRRRRRAAPGSRLQ